MALVLASFGFSLITLDVTIVNVALVAIGDELGGGTSGKQWVVDGYTLAFASLLLFAGNFSDRIGAKRAFAVGIGLFGLTSIGCALASSMPLLIAARAAQGAAAAVMLPASMALIPEASPDARQRARALGWWAAGGAVASAAGPVLGGVLAGVDWRWVFGVNVPVCAVMVVLARWLRPSPQRRVPFDWAGQVLAVVALVALVYGLVEGGVVGYLHPMVLVVELIALVALVAFIWVQGRVAHPMMPLDLFRFAGMRVALLAGFAFIGAWFGTVFLVSLYLQQGLGLTPLQTGSVFVSSAIVAVFGNLVSGPLTNRFGARFPMLLGLVSMTLGQIALAFVVPTGQLWLVAVMVTLVGAGGSVAMPPAAGLVLASVPSDQAGIASAIYNTFRQVGGAVAVAVFGVLIAGPLGLDAGLQLSFAIGAAVAAIAVLSALRGLKAA